MKSSMNKNGLATLAVLGLALTAHGALEFTNITGVVTPANMPGLNAVASDNNGTFAAVGEASTVLSLQFSPGPVSSSNAVPGTARSLKTVARDTSRFVASGFNGDVFTSANATTWSDTGNRVYTTATGGNVQGLAYNINNGRYVAVASFLLIGYSSDVFSPWSANTTIDNGSIIESFRGVTVVSGSVFAACGLRGDIRVSTNGINWNVSRPFNSAEPDLFGIATGGGRIMSVGSAGRVMVSTNNGVSWSTNSTPIGSTNNAVAFTGKEFIVVGNGGRILTGTNANASDWTTNATFGGNLRGVAFATNGILSGIALVVGDNGTVILGGPRPPEFTNPVGQTICSGSGNTSLSVNLDTNGFPVGTLIVEWLNAGGQVVASNVAATVNYHLATDTIPDGGNFPSNFVYTARARDLRTQFANNGTQVSLLISPRPSSTLDALSVTNCNLGLTNVLTGTVRGIGPWTMRWNDGTTQVVPNIGPGPVVFSRDVVATNTLPNAAVTTLYYLTNLTDANCIAIPSIDLLGTNSITVFPTPTVDLVANQGPYCNTNAGLAINFSGPVAGTTFDWTSTANVGFGTSGAGNIGVFTATNGGTSPLVATVTVTPTANGCVGPSRMFTVTVNPTPTVDAVVNQGPYCNTNAGLAINFSGPVAGTTFDWTSTLNVGFGTVGAGNIAAFTAINGGTTPLVATVTVTPTANGCVGTPRTFTVTVNPTPTVDAVANQGPYCNTNAGLAINFSGPVTGTTFDWTSTANAGFGTAGAGNIGVFTATNGGTTPLVATVTVTPTANGCVGTPRTFTVTVNPTPTVTNVVNQTQALIVGQMTAAVTLSGMATSFTWVNDNPNIGLAASGTVPAISGSGAIGAFTATNSGTATITVTPHYLNGVDCTGATTNVIITVTDSAGPPFTIEQLNSTNVVLEWYSPSNTTLLSATNLTPIIFWETNGVFGAGTNRVTNSILVSPPYQFFRLTNAP